MSNAEQATREAVRKIVQRGESPTPCAVVSELGLAHHYGHRDNYTTGGCNLNGDRSRWRAEELTALGFTKNPRTGRWQAPVQPAA